MTAGHPPQSAAFVRFAWPGFDCAAGSNIVPETGKRAGGTSTQHHTRLPAFSFRLFLYAPLADLFLPSDALPRRWGDRHPNTDSTQSQTRLGGIPWGSSSWGTRRKAPGLHSLFEGISPLPRSGALASELCRAGGFGVGEVTTFPLFFCGLENSAVSPAAGGLETKDISRPGIEARLAG